MKTLDELDGSRLYFDSNIFINALESQTGALRRSLHELFQRVYEQRCHAHTSLVTRAEVLVRPLRLRQIQLADGYRALLSGQGPIEVLAIDQHVVDRAAELRADYAALKLPDALHIATAMQTGCDLFVTGDQRLNVVSSRIPVLTLDQLPGA